MLAVHTQPAKKRKESEALASCIKRTSFEMFLCSRCKQQNITCIVSNKEKSGRCANYVCRRVKCDVKGILVKEQRSLKAKEDHLKKERKAALAIHKAAFCTAMESMARAKRLEKQQRFLKSKGKDIVRRGLKTLNKLEKAKERERQIETKHAAVEAAATQVHGQAALANPFVRIEILLLPLKVQANQDFASETPQASQGN